MSCRYKPFEDINICLWNRISSYIYHFPNLKIQREIDRYPLVNYSSELVRLKKKACCPQITGEVNSNIFKTKLIIEQVKVLLQGSMFELLEIK